VKTFATKI